MMAESVWKIPYTQPDSRALEQAGFPPLLAALLASRGVTSPADARRIVSTEYSSLYDPLLMLGMEQVRARIMQAVSSGERSPSMVTMTSTALPQPACLPTICAVWVLIAAGISPTATARAMA